MANNSDTVLLCRFCGHLSPVGSGLRCAGCGAFSGLETVGETEARRRSRRVRFDFLRSRALRVAYVVLPLLALAVWLLWEYTGLPPDPPMPTGSIGASAALPAPGDWPQAGAGIANTAATTAAVDFGRNGPAGTAWRYTAGATIAAPPAVVGNRVYVTDESGDVTALDGDNGDVLWQHESGLTAAVTPAVADGLVYVVFRQGAVSALDAGTGETVWAKRLAAASVPSATVADGRLFVAETDQGWLLALDAATGDELWRYRLSDWVIAPPVIADGRLIATSNDAKIHVVDVNTGRRLMVYDAGRRRWVRGAATLSDGLLHVSSYNGRVWGIDYSKRRYPMERPILYVRTQLWVWGFTARPPVQRGSVWAVQTDGEQPYQPALAGSILVVADESGVVTGVDVAAGEIIWETDLADDIVAPPTTAGAVALIGLESGEVVALSVADGSRRWVRDAGSMLTAAPIIAGGRLLVATDADGGTLLAAGE